MSTLDDWVCSLRRQGDTVLHTAEREDCFFAFLRRPPTAAVFAYRRLSRGHLDPMVRLGLDCLGQEDASAGPGQRSAGTLPAPRKRRDHTEFSLQLAAGYQSAVKFYFQLGKEAPFFGLVEWGKA